MTISENTRATLNRTDVITLAEKKKIREISEALDASNFARARDIINEGGGQAFTLAERKALLRICGAEDGGDDSVTTANIKDLRKTNGRINRINNMSLKAKGFWRKYWTTVGGNLGPDFSTLLDDLVAWYTLDETSGTRVNSHDPGTWDLSPLGTPTSITGVQGNGLGFADAATDYSVRATDTGAIVDTSQDFTVACWCRLTTEATNTTVWTLDSEGWQSKVRLMFQGTANSLIARSYIAADYNTPIITWDQSELAAVIVTYTAATKTLAISLNGGDEETVVVTPGISAIGASHRFAIGIYAGTASIGAGEVDEFAIAQRKWTDAERVAYYNEGGGVTYTDL